MRGNGGDGVDAGGADGGVRVAKASEEGGEHFGEVRGKSVAVRGGEDAEDADALAADWGLVGRISGGEAS